MIQTCAVSPIVKNQNVKRFPCFVSWFYIYIFGCIRGNGKDKEFHQNQNKTTDYNGNTRICREWKRIEEVNANRLKAICFEVVCTLSHAYCMLHNFPVYRWHDICTFLENETRMSPIKWTNATTTTIATKNCVCALLLSFSFKPNTNRAKKKRYFLQS